MKQIIGIIVLLAVGIGIGINLNFTKGDSASSTNTANERKIAYWVAPMNPNYRRDEPGKSPMGMDLVPVYEGGDSDDDTNAVRLSPSVINNLGVRTGKVEKGLFRSEIEAVGYISYDDNKITHIHMRAESWIEKLYVNSVGERVKKGDALFDVYSPELVNAQSDYLNALKMGRKGLISASKERLKALDIPEELIAKITKTKKISQLVKIRAPRDGIVSALNVIEGMHVTSMTTTVSLVDLSKIWVLIDVFESQSSLIKDGLDAVMRLSYEPGRVWKGKLTYVYPEINPKTRTLTARLEFDNPGELLKPDMYASITIMGEDRPDTIMIPREALIRTGKSERVIVALGEGRFQPAKVKAGLEADGKIEILEGLSEGENVVISAQFLIDSEASFNGSVLRMSPAQVETTEAMDMDNMKEKPIAEEPPAVWGVGIVNKIMSSDGKLNVTHDPIKALDWPSMAMDFLFSDSVDISLIEQGSEIHFRIVKDESGMYKIVEIMDMQEMGK